MSTIHKNNAGFSSEVSQQKVNHNSCIQKPAHLSNFGMIKNRGLSVLPNADDIQQRALPEHNELYESEANRVGFQASRLIDRNLVQVHKQDSSGMSEKQLNSHHLITGRRDTSNTGLKSLPIDFRSSAENVFNASFSDVRLHFGREGSVFSDLFDAEALTHGRDIYFAEGKFAPHTSEGRRLICHELVHVLQQNSTLRNSSSNTDGVTISQIAPTPRVQCERGRRRLRGHGSRGRSHSSERQRSVVSMIAQMERDHRTECLMIFLAGIGSTFDISRVLQPTTSEVISRYGIRFDNKWAELVNDRLYILLTLLESTMADGGEALPYSCNRSRALSICHFLARDIRNNVIPDIQRTLGMLTYRNRIDMIESHYVSLGMAESEAADRAIDEDLEVESRISTFECNMNYLIRDISVLQRDPNHQPSYLSIEERGGDDLIPSGLHIRELLSHYYPPER